MWPLFSADPHAPKSQRPAAGDVFQIGSLGRLHAHKGYDVLIRALAKLKHEAPALCETFHVTIGGDGPDRQDFELAAQALGVTNLTFADYQTDTKPFLAGLHGYVQPSRVEGLCIAAHEAMQAGLPMIVSETGEMPRSVQRAGAGFVVEPANVSDLAAAIRTLVSNRALAADMGSAGRDFVNDAYSAAGFRSAGLAIMTTVGQLAQPTRRSA